MRSWKLDKDELRRLQDRKLRRLLTSAYATVPFYHDEMKEAGRMPGDIGGVGDLWKLPSVTKAMAAAAYPDRIMAKGMKSAQVRGGSGTSGTRFTNEQSPESMWAREAARVRMFLKMGVFPWTRVLTLWPPPSTWKKDEEGQPTTPMYDLAPRFTGRRMPGTRPIMIPLDPDRADFSAASGFRPEFIACRPSHLRRLAGRLIDTGVTSDLRGLITTAEAATDVGIKELEMKFGVRTFMPLGSAETSVLATECKFHTGLHFTEDFIVVEVLRGDEPVGPGETGEIAITVLHNLLMPLIRFRTGDYALLADDDKCGCGSNFRRVKKALGRSSDWVVTAGGERVWGLNVADQLESEFGLRDFQLIQRAQTDFVLRLTERELDEAAWREVKNYLGGLVGAEVKLDTEERPIEELWSKIRPVYTKIK